MSEKTKKLSTNTTETSGVLHLAQRSASEKTTEAVTPVKWIKPVAPETSENNVKTPDNNSPSSNHSSPIVRSQ